MKILTAYCREHIQRIQGEVSAFSEFVVYLRQNYMQCGFLLIRSIQQFHIKDKLHKMEKKQPLFTLSKPKWSWVKIDSQLKTKIDGKSARVSLKPTVTFQQWNEGGFNSDIIQRVIIDTEKSLQHENEVGWNWHKSSNLPIISIKLQVKKSNSENLLPLPENLEAKIFAVKIIVNTLQRNQIAVLEDVGIRGNSKIELKDGCGFFSGIRFMSTSYNNEGVKFYLLIVIYAKSQGGKFDDTICSVLSPPIFVDSRKSARDYQEKRFLSFVELFEPNLFTKDFIKRQNKMKTDAVTSINNDIDGLFNYLTAPNIRHKVKHPLFLCQKFSNAFKILYNKNYFQNKQVNIDELIKKLQKKLIKDIGGEKKNKKALNKASNKPFLIILQGQCTNHKKSKIMECLEYLDCKAIELVQYNCQLSQNYEDITLTGDIAESYTQNYSSLCKSSNKEISGRKNRQEQALEMSVRDDFNDDSEDDQKIKKQPKEELYRSKSMEEKSSESDHARYTFSSQIIRRYNPRNRRPKIQEYENQLFKKRIDNQMNPITMIAQNLLQPLKNEGKNQFVVNSAFNLADGFVAERLQEQIQGQREDIMIKNEKNHGNEIIFNVQANDLSNPNLQNTIPDINPKINIPIPISNIPVPNIPVPMSAPSVPLHIQSHQMTKNKFMQNMDQAPSQLQPSLIKVEKQHMKNELLAQLDIQNNMLQQMILDNQMMKSRVQMLFEYDLIQGNTNNIPQMNMVNKESIRNLKDKVGSEIKQEQNNPHFRLN